MGVVSSTNFFGASVDINKRRKLSEQIRSKTARAQDNTGEQYTDGPKSTGNALQITLRPSSTKQRMSATVGKVKQQAEWQGIQTKTMLEKAAYPQFSTDFTRVELPNYNR